MGKKLKPPKQIKRTVEFNGKKHARWMIDWFKGSADFEKAFRHVQNAEEDELADACEYFGVRVLEFLDWMIDSEVERCVEYWGGGFAEYHDAIAEAIPGLVREEEEKVRMDRLAVILKEKAHRLESKAALMSVNPAFPDDLKKAAWDAAAEALCAYVKVLGELKLAALKVSREDS